MGLSTRDAERIGDGVFSDRFIGDDTYCAGCGYNLRTQPFIGGCPECAAEYNARPMKMINIFNPQIVRFPVGELIGGMVAALLSGLFFFMGWSSKSGWQLIMGLIIGGLVPFYARNVWRLLGQYIRAQRILARIREEADDDDDEWLDLVPDDR